MSVRGVLGVHPPHVRAAKAHAGCSVGVLPPPPASLCLLLLFIWHEVASCGPHACLPRLHPPLFCSCSVCRRQGPAWREGRGPLMPVLGVGQDPTGQRALGSEEGRVPAGQPSSPAADRPPSPRALRGTLPHHPGRAESASQAGLSLFTKWSRGLGFLSQQQARLQTDRECHWSGSGPF